jgi:hypothetical protein
LNRSFDPAQVLAVQRVGWCKDALYISWAIQTLLKYHQLPTPQAPALAPSRIQRNCNILCRSFVGVSALAVLCTERSRDSRSQSLAYLALTVPPLVVYAIQSFFTPAKLFLTQRQVRAKP